MLDKLFNLISDDDGNLKFSIWCVVVVTCIILAGIVQGMQHMATLKQLNFIKAICNELDLDEPGEDITTRAASRFISKYATKFYVKKTKDKENGLKISSNSHYKYESSFKANEEITRMTTKQNVENIKNICRNYFGYDIWAGKKRQEELT